MIHPHRLRLWAIILILAGGMATALILVYAHMQAGLVAKGSGYTDREIAEIEKKIHAHDPTAPAAPTVLQPLDLKSPVRLALGGLGLADDDQNGRLNDLVLADLTGAEGLDLVERQSLEAVLRELNLSLSGLVRAGDAVRAGKLLKADWFLLGTRAEINGTNSIVVRLVDARTGILRDAGVFPSAPPLAQLAANIAAFVRQSRQEAATARTPVFLAIGAFEDLSVNNRQAGFPAQLRGYLTAAYQGGNVTLLEREYVDALLQEVRLDLAGLTAESGTNAPAPMPSAYWLVDGYYQSYETTNLEVELTLEVHRMFGKTKLVTLRAPPGEPVSRQVKQAIDEFLRQSDEITIPSRNSEIRSQMEQGKELAQIKDELPSHLGLVWLYSDSEYLDTQGNASQEGAARRKRNVEEAIRAFETVLLLDPTNREAKMYLAACFRSPLINRQDEARNYYHEILEEQVADDWNQAAQQGVITSFDYAPPDEKARWFEQTRQGATNTPAEKFYQEQAEKAETDIAIASGDGAKIADLAEKRLFEEMESSRNFFGRQTGTLYPDMGIGDFAKTFGTNRAALAQRLVELLPKMKGQFPELEPYLLAILVTYQTDTNAPVVAEFQQKLAEISQHPDQVFTPEEFWPSLDDVYNWSCDHKLYELALEVMAAKSRAGAEGRLATVLRLYKDEDRIKLAYAYMGLEHWQQAADIFESFSNAPVRMSWIGPWGGASMILQTGKEAAFCLEKLGQTPVRDPREFEMGKDCFCLCTPSTFVADEGGLWIGIGNQLLLLNFELKTNLAVTLPKDSATAVNCLCLSANTVWVGTDGDGLIEFDKKSHECRRLTEQDGLLMNNISALNLAGDVLWIGYGHRAYNFTSMGESDGGGLGTLDLSTRQLTSFMPPLNDKDMPRHLSPFEPTRSPVFAIAEGTEEEVWFLTQENHRTQLRRYGKHEKTWEVNEQSGSSLAIDQERLFLGQYSNWNGGSETRPLGVSILDFKDHKWRNLGAIEGLPGGAVSALAVDGDNLWIGGLTYIALVDPEKGRLLKFARIQARVVDKIQIGGGNLWAQYDWHLHRAPLDESP